MSNPKERCFGTPPEPPCCRRGSLMTGGAPKRRTIKTDFSLPGSAAEKAASSNQIGIRLTSQGSGALHLDIFEKPCRNKEVMTREEQNRSVSLRDASQAAWQSLVTDLLLKEL